MRVVYVKGHKVSHYPSLQLPHYLTLAILLKCPSKLIAYVNISN